MCVLVHAHTRTASLTSPKSTNQNDIRKLGFEKDEALAYRPEMITEMISRDQHERNSHEFVMLRLELKV